VFTFLNPLFLIGLAAAAIPLVIHLSRSRRRKRMQFSTTRFFTDQFVRSYRMSRLKELGLLAARMALFALFAAALARPLLLPEGRSYLTGRRSVVLVLDNSASMGYADKGVTMLDRAKVAARAVLDGLGDGDAAALVLAGRRASGPEALFPEPTFELGDVRQALDQVTVSALGTDLTRAVARAEQVARESSARSREVYILSDLQDSGWELGGETDTAEGTSDLLYFFVSLRPESPENLAVTAVQYAAARPVAGIPFAIRPHVRNEGKTVRAVDVALFVDGEKVGEKRLEGLQPGRWEVPRFHHTFASGGWHSGYVAITSDELEADNQRYFAFDVLDAIPVLAVNGSPSDVARLDELFFLRTALTASAGGQGPVQLDETGPAELDGLALDAYPLVLMANVESLPVPAVEKLEAYVDRGGCLFVFLGDKPRADSYNEHFAVPARLHGGLLPARLVAIEGNPGGDQEAAFVASVDYDHPALTAFQDPGFSSLQGVTFNALWTLTPREDALILMQASTGSPLLCERPFGKGRVLLFAGACDRDWGNFPVRPAFLPWIHRLVAYLAQEPLARDGFFTTGEPVPLPVSAGEGARPTLVKMPDGTLANATVGTGAEAPLVFDGTSQSGVYAVYQTEEADTEQLFVANLEAYESDLTYLDDVLGGDEEGRGGGNPAHIEAGFRDLLPGRPLLRFVPDADAVADASLTARRGIKLWDLFLMVVLAIALVEPWIANRISLRHYMRAKAASGDPGTGAPSDRQRKPIAEEAGARQ
jgi:Aerotolerance regulator N-terminal/von Willebrand factor type A domain